MRFLSDIRLPVLKYFIGILIMALPGCHGEDQKEAEKEIITIFHAGSLSVPFKRIAKEFEQQNPKLKVQLEAAGSVTSVRKVTDLKRECDLLALADYTLIDRLLIPDFASWTMQFASNEMSLAYTDKSKYAKDISTDNWAEIISREDVRYGRSNPDSDPCGYRTVLSLKLADLFYPAGLDYESILAKDNRYIRPKETDLLALLETNTIDYMFIYSSVAIQHDLKYIALPDSINLSNPTMSEFYSRATVAIAGNEPGTKLDISGQAMVYGFTIPKSAKNPERGIDFARFLLDPDYGLKIMEESGQKVIDVKLSESSISDPRL